MVYEVCKIGSDFFLFRTILFFWGVTLILLISSYSILKRTNSRMTNVQNLKIAERREKCVKHTEINKYENNDIYLQDKVFKS